MRTFGRLGALVGALFLLIPSIALAQASITGAVKDTSGAVLPGVTVEAASPVLIEKVRTVVTDSNGRYQLVDLRPGSYVVTFTLPGFNTVKREGVTVSGSGIVTVDGELRVGSLEETITVTGEAPIVDVRSSTQQRVLNADVIDALPSSRNYFGLARMMPNTMGGGNDVGGGLIQDVGQSVTVHGSRNVDQRVTVNGVNTMTLQAGGNIGGQTPDVGSAAEVTVDTNSLSADLPTGGVRINFVPKDGGNRFSSSTFLNFTNDSLQGDNFSDELRAAGLTTPNRIVNGVRHQRIARRAVQERQGVVLVFHALQHHRKRGCRLREPERLQPERLAVRPRYDQSGREQGLSVQQQPSCHVAGFTAQQDRRHVQGRQMVQLSEQHQRQRVAGSRP